ncbi:putative RDD family membrane protein YckC [Salinibacter ruber]|uniref:RDD family protein n=1 Tax=Salinibacter ruber TaxID=146919 RepID=UPI00161CFE73|nr:RDD family protein [Salinibacter ruber]MBB4069227.1 putative RDD family membrane protein YckC [Salinibacter ruber]
MWYYAVDGERKGPLTEEEIVQLIYEGDLDLDDFIWKPGMDDWKQISDVEDIPPTPPPPPGKQPPASSPASSQEEQSPTGGRTDPDPRASEPSVSAKTETTSAGRRPQDDGSRATGGGGTSEVPYAGFGRRLIAYVVDVLILFAAFVVFGGVLLGLSGASQVPPEGVLNVVGFLASWMYFALNESSERQATWGKQLMGLKVTGLNGNKIGFGKATGRHFGKILSGMILLIGFIMAAFTERKQALHDKMAGCLVLEGPAEEEERRPGTEEKRQAQDEQQKDVGETVSETEKLHIRRAGSSQPQTGRFELDDYEKKCPSCAGYIKLEASGCRYCGYKFSSEEVKQQIARAKRPDADSVNPSKIKAVNDGDHCVVCGEKCSNWGNPQIRVCEVCIEIPGVQERVNKFDYS